MPTVASTTPNSNCGPGTVALGATASTGATISWFENSSGGSALTTGTSYTTPSISTTTSYWVSASDEHCTSARTEVIATIYNIPTVASTTPNSNCGPGTVALGATASTGATISWFENSSGGSALATGTSYTTTSISSSTTYYVSATKDGCTSGRTAVLATIYAIPSLSGTASACVGATTQLSATTSGSNWSSSNTSVATVSSTGLVTGVAAGTVTITFSNTNNCSATYQVTVTSCELPQGVYPTEVSPSGFANGVGTRLAGIALTKGTKNNSALISNATPGVFFFITTIPANQLNSGGGTFYINQVNVTNPSPIANKSTVFSLNQLQITAYKEDGQTKISGSVSTINTGNSYSNSFKFTYGNLLGAKKVILFVKYDSKSILNYPYDLNNNFRIAIVNNNNNPLVSAVDFRASTDYSGTQLVTSGISILPNANTSMVSKTVVEPEVVTLKAEDVEINAYPNPFINKVNFSLVSSKTGSGVLRIFDMNGNLVATLFDGTLTANVTEKIEFAPNLSKSLDRLIYRFEKDGQLIKSGYIIQGN
ncbi:Ig-like domain-containing protein [Sandaracinomonas limnophila]|uniref:Ig-like domain-containing protein n=1 Tax=Sandaracinomonas limnophila TaxID=1862386 RepID=UPI001EEE64B3|nr:Ig-like domain-containing protein [Sandaracinomonas limnophila]